MSSSQPSLFARTLRYMGMTTLDQQTMRATYANEDSKFFPCDGNEIHYRVEGRTDSDAPVLVMLHGIMASLHTWDGWVKELKENNYLHNHTRMWFASIWIFTLKLPWQKGAEFFLRELYDGDAASNTLSWRWVAGIQTKGKNYIAQNWNINKFTNNKYKDLKLNENPQPIIDQRDYKVSPLSINNNETVSDKLVFFENELDFQFFNIDNHKKVYCILLANDERQVKLGSKVLDYKKNLIKNQIQNSGLKIEFIEGNKFIELSSNDKDFDIVYPSIGENMSFLKRVIKKNNLNINYLTREEDNYCWQFSNKGYFNFKSNIPKILSQFKLN